MSDQRTSLITRYRAVLTLDGVAFAFAAGLLARMAVAMNSLAILLVIKHATGSYGIGGVAGAAYAVAFAVTAPGRARRADLNGPTGVLRFSVLAQPLSWALLSVLARHHANKWPLIVSAGVIGACIPPIGPVTRSLWNDVIEDEQLRVAAYSLEAVLIEVCFVTGPLAVTLIVSASNAIVAGLVSAALGTLGTYALVRSNLVVAVVPHPDRVHSFFGPLTSARVRAFLGTILWIGLGFGAAELGVIAFVDEHHHSRAVGGVVLALWSLGSALGGLTYGALHLKRTVEQQLPVIVILMCILGVLPSLSPGIIVLAIAMMGYGATIAPFMTVNSMLLGSAAPDGTVNEAFAWSSSLLWAGGAFGTALAGILVDSFNARAALIVVAVAGLLAVTTELLGAKLTRS